MSKAQKNGKIEFARFAFAIIIMLFHIGDDLLPNSYRVFGNFTFFNHGFFGVEFFFIVSGYLMALSAFKTQNNVIPLGKDTFNFLKKKLMAILPFHILVFGITFAYSLVVRLDEGFDYVFKYLIRVIPNALLIQRSGFKCSDVLGVEWYISDMLIAMFVLYPLCKKYYEKFTRIIAPIASLLILGYLIKTTGALNGSKAWSVIFSKTFLRAVSEICAGAFAFEFTRNFKKLNFSKADKIGLTIFEVFCYIMVLVYITYDIPKNYVGVFFIFACIGISLSFSDVTYGAKLFNNKFIYFLGSLSLPLYLCHSLTRKLTRSFTQSLPNELRVIIFILLTFAFSFCVIPLEKRLRVAINNKINKLTSQQ